jgi:hypothetical protein
MNRLFTEKDWAVYHYAIRALKGRMEPDSIYELILKVFNKSIGARSFMRRMDHAIAKQQRTKGD